MVSARVAILVDGDNVSATHAARILRDAARLGRIDMARVYLDASRNPGWGAAAGFRIIHAGVGKNASDLLLSIDAMQCALTSDVTSFVLASSDGDFIHLAQRLRELGKRVLGLGEAKAPEAFRAACSEFAFLDSDTGVTDFDLSIRKMIAANSKNGQGMRIKELGARLQHPDGTKIKWRAYLSAREHLYELDPKGDEAKVRFRKDGFSAITEG